MKISDISCKQFAGIRDKSLSFDDGINVVYGKNETGKSTMVNLLSRTLFQNAKMDARTDKAFKELYFPGKLKDSNISGDFIDGKVTFEAGGETYTLEKEWGTEPRLELSTPDGRIRDKKKIDEILKGVLIYGEGVYTDMLLSSQKNTDISLETLLDASKKTDAKQEITDVVTRAFAESDGISIDMVAQAIDKRIETIEGMHWNYEDAIPQKRSGSGRWASGLGEIIKSYYDYEDKKNILEQIEVLEKEADSAIENFTIKEEEFANAQDTFNNFNTYAGKLKEQNAYKTRLNVLEKDIDRYEETLAEWPKMEDQLKEALILKKEQKDRDTLDKYYNVKQSYESVEDLAKKLSNTLCPSSDELKCVKNAIKDTEAYTNKLSGMNLSARLKMLKGNPIEIISVRTGERIKIEGENAHIEEAVNIVIPGIMEMQLSPADVDADALNYKINELKEAVCRIYKKYDVNSVEQLENLAVQYTQIKQTFESERQRLEISLGNDTYDDLKAKSENISPDVREKADIEAAIKALTGHTKLESFIAGIEALISRNEKEYVNITGLKDKIDSAISELNVIKDGLKDLDDIPQEYLELSNPAEYLEELTEKVKDTQIAKEEALTAKTTAISRLEAYTERLEGDPEAEAEEAERKFDELKEQLAQWKHIKEVFLQKKSEMSGNPMEDIAERFTHYLDLISGGKVISEFTEQDKLDMNIYSGNRLMDYGKLSEGTKETVSIAFRLAVLEHLFPNGGGVAVFDDPFNNMDADRMTKACNLIKEFAKRHQVIFLTCKEDYIHLLGGNLIEM